MPGPFIAPDNTSVYPDPTAGAMTHSKLAAASTNATLVKAGQANLHGFMIYNNTAVVKFVRFYDKATAPVPASDAALIKFRVTVPANNIAFLETVVGIDFLLGLGYDATGAVADTDATVLAANDLSINLLYA
jgi:hypothetical protein